MKEYIITTSDIIFYTTIVFVNGCATTAAGFMLYSGNIPLSIMSFVAILSSNIYGFKLLTERRVK